jgi:Rieske Fe-S protein
MKIDESPLARRRFLGGMICGGAAAAGAGAAMPLLAYVANLRPEPLPDFLVLERDDYQLPPEGFRIVMYGPVPALILKMPEPEGELRAFIAICTHLDCTVSYRADSKRIFCACHEGYYDLDGKVLAGPPPRPLPRLHTRLLDDGKLILAIERENLEKALEQD